MRSPSTGRRCRGSGARSGLAPRPGCEASPWRAGPRVAGCGRAPGVAAATNGTAREAHCWSPSSESAPGPLPVAGPRRDCADRPATQSCLLDPVGPAQPPGSPGRSQALSRQPLGSGCALRPGPARRSRPPTGAREVRRAGQPLDPGSRPGPETRAVVPRRGRRPTRPAPPAGRDRQQRQDRPGRTPIRGRSSSRSRRRPTRPPSLRPTGPSRPDRRAPTAPPRGVAVGRDRRPSRWSVATPIQTMEVLGLVERGSCRREPHGTLTR